MILSFFEWGAQHKASHPTLIFLHGLGGTGQIWRPITAQLEEEFHCIAPDQRGHGESRPVPAGNSFHALDYAADVAELIAAQSIENYYLVGHSMGVRTALALGQMKAKEGDNGLKGLMCVDIGITSEWGGGIGLPLAQFIQNLPTHFQTRAGLRDYVMNYCPDPSIGQYLAAVSKKESENPEAWVFPFDHSALVETIHHANEAPIPEWLRTILDAQISTVFLRGERSRVWSKEDYEKQKAQFAHPALTFEEWDNCGHGLPFEQRIRFIERVRQFAR